MRFTTPALLNSLGLRVLGAYLAGVVLSIALIVGLLFALTTLRTEAESRERVAKLARELAKRLAFDDAGAPVGFRQTQHTQDWIFQSLKSELAYRVLDDAGNVVLNSPVGDRPWASAGVPQRSAEQDHFAFEQDGLAMRAATEVVPRAGRTWFVQVAGSARLSNLFDTEVVLPLAGKSIVVFSTVLLIVFGACSYLTLKRTFKPLREISASAALISPRSLNARLELKGVPSEVVPLVQSFNRALDRLERGYKVQQQFLASAAHELKTPLALIRTQIELSIDGAERETLLQDVAHITRQVQQLLLLAEASEDQNYRIEPVDVGELAREVVEYLRRMAQASDVRIELNPVALRPTWLADRGALFTLLKNLLENAIQHAPRGTAVHVEPGAQELIVRDGGPGVSEDQLAHLFERFWRGPDRRDQGAGLGLSICQEVAHAHGWALTAHRLGPGLEFRLSKPQARAAATKRSDPSLPFSSQPVRASLGP